MKRTNSHLKVLLLLVFSVSSLDVAVMTVIRRLTSRHPPTQRLPSQIPDHFLLLKEQRRWRQSVRLTRMATR